MKKTFGNTAGNTKFVPTDADKAAMKTIGIGWHPRGGWCRKFSGDSSRTYFGHVKPDIAARAAIKAESRPRNAIRVDGLLLPDAADIFYLTLDSQLVSGHIGIDQRSSYEDEIGEFIDVVGKIKLNAICQTDAPTEIFKPAREAAMERGVFAAEKHIVQLRTFFGWCHSIRKWIGEPHYGDQFRIPSKKEKNFVQRASRKELGAAFWQPPLIRKLIDEVSPLVDVHFVAQCLLMINGGMGQGDLSKLRDDEYDASRGLIRTDRSKTLVDRALPVWTRTAIAIEASRAERPKAASKEFAGLMFLTRKGRPIVESYRDADTNKIHRTDSVKNRFHQIIHGTAAVRKTRVPRMPELKRHRAGAYTLRSVFTTLSLGHNSDANLQAVILGQNFNHEMLGPYIRDDQFEKLKKITDYVESQIWPAPVAEPSQVPS